MVPEVDAGVRGSGGGGNDAGAGGQQQDDAADLVIMSGFLSVRSVNPWD
jgi:hypothetical protein